MFYELLKIALIDSSRKRQAAEDFESRSPGMKGHRVRRDVDEAETIHQQRHFPDAVGYVFVIVRVVVIIDRNDDGGVAVAVRVDAADQVIPDAIPRPRYAEVDEPEVIGGGALIGQFGGEALSDAGIPDHQHFSFPAGDTMDFAI